VIASAGVWLRCVLDGSTVRVDQAIPAGCVAQTGTIA